MSIELKDTTGIKDGRYVVSGICHNCRDWNSGSINFNSTKQPMILAVGPDNLNLNSNAKDAALRRHDSYGTFDLNLQLSWGDPNLFPPEDLSEAKVTDHSEQNDHEYSSSVHAVLMIGTFVAIFPIGIFYKTILGKVRWHYFTQILGVIVMLVGAAPGLALSPDYNRVFSLSVVCVFLPNTLITLLVQAFQLGPSADRLGRCGSHPPASNLGWHPSSDIQSQAKAHHHGHHSSLSWAFCSLCGHRERFLVSRKLPSGFGHRCHRLLLIPFHRGFDLAQSRKNVGYAIVIVLMAIILFGGGYWQLRRRRRQEAFNTPSAQNFRSSYHPQPSSNDIPLQPTYDPPPGYGRPMGA